MTVLRADGMIVTLHGLCQPGALWTTALRGPARTTDTRKLKKRLNARRRLKSTNMPRDAKASNANLLSLRLRSPCPRVDTQRFPATLKVYPNPHPTFNTRKDGPLGRREARDIGLPCVGNRSPILGCRLSVVPDLVGRLAIFQSLVPGVDLCLDLEPYLGHSLD